jgi:cytoskeletal protein RodZ
MDQLPKTTLTQKRSQVTGNTPPVSTPPVANTMNTTPPVGATKLDKMKLDHSDDMALKDKGAITKIILWIVVVVFVGIGSALLLTNLIGKDANTTATPTSAPVTEVTSYPVATLEPTVTTTVTTTPTVTTTVTPTDEATTGTLKTVDSLATYSADDRYMPADAPSTKSLILNKFRFKDTTSEFNYTFTEVGSTTTTLDPDVKLYYEGTDLLLVFTNVSVDRVTGNGNTTTRAFTNVTGITGTETSNKDGVSTYRFKMDKKYQSKLTVTQDTKEILLQIDNH